LKKLNEYFVLFQKMGNTQNRSAQLLTDAIKNPNIDYTGDSTKLEHEGDQTASEIFKRLNNVFIAPLDRDEIYHLTYALDNVIDKTDEVISNLKICNIANVTEAMLSFARLIDQSSSYLAKMIYCFSNKNERKDLDDLRKEIHIVESDGDDVYKKELTRLFSVKGINAIYFRKNERIIERLEEALDARQKACDILMGIYLKWS